MSVDNPLKEVLDPSVGDWIAPELSGTPGSVSRIVPDRFDSYVRILHPAEAPDGRLVRWGEVADSLRVAMQPLMQWHVLVGSTDPDSFEGSGWNGTPPEGGDLDLSVLCPLCDLLASYTDKAAECFFGLWLGLEWVRLEATPNSPRREGEGALGHRVLSRSVADLAGSRLRLPGRDYVLLTGPVSAATRVPERDEAPGSGLAPTSPNLMWPADRAWFLASEIDFDSTLVGGTGELCDAIVDTEGIEAWPVRPQDSLAADGEEPTA